MDEYLLLDENDIELVFKPGLQFLNDDFFPNTKFPKTVETIKSSMIFYEVFGYGDSGDYEREYFSYKEFNSKRSHTYRGIAYNELNKHLNFVEFEVDLNKLISDLEFRFIEQLEEKIKMPNFEIPLMQHLKSIQTSIDSLILIDLSRNRIKDLVKAKFLESYYRVIEILRERYFLLYDKPFLVLKKENKIGVQMASVDWHFILVEILTGKIVITQDSMYTTKYFYEDEEFSSPSKIGNIVAKKLNKKVNSIRPILTDTIYGGIKSSKNIFVKKNASKIEMFIGKYGNKMCAYFQSKYDELI